MNNELTIPELNPVLFYDKARALLPQYHNKFAGDWLPLEALKPWQGFGRYFQKWQTSDAISLQVFSNIAPLTLKLINCKGATIRTLQFQQKQKNRRDPSLFIYEASLSLAGIPDGRYRLELEVGSPLVKTLESDWLDIAADWPHSALIEYKNSAYYGDVIFPVTGWAPSFRVEGWFKKAAPASKDEVYVDESYNQRMMFSDPFQVWEFIIGPATGVPEWVAEKLNWILGCDEIYIDGMEFTKADGGKFQEIEQDGVPFRGYSINLAPTNRRPSKHFFMNGAQGGKRLLVALNVETKGFADTSLGSSSDVATIIDVE